MNTERLRARATHTMPSVNKSFKLASAAELPVAPRITPPSARWKNQKVDEARTNQKKGSSRRNQLGNLVASDDTRTRSEMCGSCEAVSHVCRAGVTFCLDSFQSSKHQHSFAFKVQTSSNGAYGGV
jgi:hypothetical protein